MLGDLLRAFGQLGEPGTIRLILFSILGSVGLFLVVMAGVGWVVTETSLFETVWLDWLVDALAGLLTLVLSWFLFPAVVVAISSMMGETVIRTVERRWYPGQGPPRQQPFFESLFGSIRFLAVVIAVNLLALPLYLVPGLAVFAVPMVNGYLIGREYYEMIAFRHLTPASARILRRQNSGRVLLAGSIIALLTMVPILNLVLPVVATAFMVHVFHGMQRLPRGFVA